MNINPKLLSELIQVSVKKALKEQLPILLEAEMYKFKKELLKEQATSVQVPSQRQSTIRHDSNSKVPTTHRSAQKFSEKYQLSPKPKVKYSGDPMLNEILSSTQPIRENSYMEMFNHDDYEQDNSSVVNVPTTEAGTPISSAPASVIAAMNRDYSGMFSNKETSASKPKVKVQETNKKPNESFRNKVMSIMEADTDSTEDVSFDEYGLPNF